MRTRSAARARGVALAAVGAAIVVATSAPRGAVSAGVGAPQGRAASAVLSEMRRAMGGDAALDAVTRFTVSGSAVQTANGFTKSLSLQWSVLLPDHFLDVRHDRDISGPREVDITYYSGFRGDALIRRTDANIPFPPDPWPQTPDEIARRERTMVRENQQTFARIALMLFGRSFSAYELRFEAAAGEVVEGRALEVVRGTGPDGQVFRLLVDEATHLPAAVVYLAPQVYTVSVRSTVAVQGGRVVSESPGVAAPAVDVNGLPLVEHRLVPADFKTQDGLTWPHRLTDTVSPREFTRIDLGKFRLNPKLEAKAFDIGR